MGKPVILVRTGLTTGQLEYIGQGTASRYAIVSEPYLQTVNLPETVRQETRVLIVHELPKTELEQYPHLSFVQIYGRGIDKVCTEELENRGIIWKCCGSGAAGESIAEYVLLQILYWERGLEILNRMGHGGNWTWGWRSAFQYRSLGQIKVGIIGNGVIGCEVFRFLSSVGANPFYINAGHRMNTADEELIGEMDYISIHLPLREGTEYLIDKYFFSMMNQNAVLINTSRGKIIKEADLVEALCKGKIRAVSLDVTEKEPLGVLDDITHCKNSVITPHISGRTEAALHGYAEEIVKNIMEKDWR